MEEQRQYCERQISLISKTTHYFCLLLLQRLLYKISTSFYLYLVFAGWSIHTSKSVITDSQVGAQTGLPGNTTVTP